MVNRWLNDCFYASGDDTSGVLAYGVVTGNILVSTVLVEENLGVVLRKLSHRGLGGASSNFVAETSAVRL